jgi:hypothetical protein
MFANSVGFRCAFYAPFVVELVVNTITASALQFCELFG